jgi:hypothetical protein
VRRRRQFAQLIVLTAAIGLVLALTAYKAEQNATRRARFHERDLKQEAAFELGREVNERVRMAFKAGLTFREFAEAFGSPTELNEVADPKHVNMTHSLFHEKSQATFHLQFLDGRLVGFQSNHGPSDVDTGVVLETAAFLRSESVRTSVLSSALLAWCVVLVAGIRIRRFRGRAAVLLVAASIVCGLCWFLAPNYSPTWRGVLSNDNLAIFGLLLIASLGFGVMTAPRGEDVDAMDGFRGFVAH